MPSNSAAWIDAKGAGLRVGPAPYTAPRDDEVVIRNRAVAVNPLDVIKQTTGDLMYSWLKYPILLGEDVAGEVVEVGSAVTRFAVGDRVLAYAVGMEKQRNATAEGAFQLYTVALDRMTSPIPDSLRFEQAAVLPLALSTAASALFQQDQLGLQHPSLSPVPTGQTVLVWGGSSSVGSNAIQLAIAAGYDVITTASPRNHEFVRGLGAAQAFDYRSPTVVSDIVAAVQGRTLAGAIAAGTGSANPTVAVVAACAGGKRVAMASPPLALDAVVPTGRMTPRAVLGLTRLGSSTAALQVTSRARGVRARFIWGSSLMNNEVGRMIFEDFLPKALAAGRYVAAPEPRVVGTGLEHIQTAIDELRKGVSAQKLVVTL